MKIKINKIPLNREETKEAMKDKINGFELRAIKLTDALSSLYDYYPLYRIKKFDNGILWKDRVEDRIPSEDILTLKSVGILYPCERGYLISYKIIKENEDFFKKLNDIVVDAIFRNY